MSKLVARRIRRSGILDQAKTTKRKKKKNGPTQLFLSLGPTSSTSPGEKAQPLVQVGPHVP